MTPDEPQATPTSDTPRDGAPPVPHVSPPDPSPRREAGGQDAKDSAPPPGPPAPAGGSDEQAAPPDLDLFGKAPKGRPDWSHRRGEPRVFALLWTMFLTILATTTLMRAAVGGRLDLVVYRQSLRMMLMVVATAIVVGWPLLRLSQARPRGWGAGSAFRDVLILLVPLQAVLWPQAVLAHWPLAVVAALDGILIVWAMMVGSIVALALGPATQDPQGLPDAEISRPEDPRGRMGIMAIIIGLGAVGGACAFVLDAALRPADDGLDAGSWWMMLSPHTAINEITRDRAELGVSARVEPVHFKVLAAQAGLAAVLWLFAVVGQWLASAVRRVGRRA